MDGMSQIQTHTHSQQLSHKHPGVLSVFQGNHIVSFQQRLFTQWNFNWKKTWKHTEGFKSKLWWAEKCCFCVLLFNITWILWSIRAPRYFDDRTSITNAYLACLSLSRRRVGAARQIEMLVLQIKIASAKMGNCLNRSSLRIATTGKTMELTQQKVHHNEVCAALIIQYLLRLTWE